VWSFSISVTAARYIGVCPRSRSSSESRFLANSASSASWRFFISTANASPVAPFSTSAAGRNRSVELANTP